MSIYIPASYQAGGAKQWADSLIDIVDHIAEQYPDKFALANTPEQIEANFDKGLISLPMGMENGRTHRRLSGKCAVLLQQRHPLYYPDP